jgi:O-antigen/teichoic acid export membrane protein
MLTFYVSVLGRPRLEIRWDVLKRLGREVPTFAGIAVSYAIYLNVDQIMLSKLMGIEAVGLYGSAKRLVQILKTLPLSFSAALLPFFTREYATGRQALANLCANSVRYVFLAVMPIVMGTVILADSMITLIFGNKFAAAGNLLRGQILVLIPFGMVYIFSDVLLATNNQKVVMKVLAVCAAVNFVLNLLLIPFFDEMGAVLATLTTIVIFNELQRLYVRRHLFAIPLLPSVIKALGAAICMGLVTYLLKQSNIFLNVIISTVVYLTLVITVRGVSWEEVQLIGRIITLRRKREDG